MLSRQGIAKLNETRNLEISKKKNQNDFDKSYFCRGTPYPGFGRDTRNKKRCCAGEADSPP